MRHTARRKSLPLAIALVCEAGWGQSTEAPKPEALPEPIRIEVTGSRIARIDGETALPVQIIGRDEIERGNWTTAAELMAHVSANFNGTNSALNVGNPFSAGLSSANLRGIGDGNTLVLLNGRRIANYAIAAATVDLSTIPLAAIERVEILKDGASSIYGTDAIAGVVNFITRKNFAGAEITGQAGVTEQGGGNHYQATFTAGWGDLTKDKFNAFVTVDWQKDTALAASQRPFSASGYRPDDGFVSLQGATFPANVRRPNGSLRNPSFADGCQPPLSIRLVASCAYDYANGYDLLPEQQEWNVIGRATWEWTPGQQVFAEYVYSRNELDARSAPAPAARPQTIDRTPILYPAGGPYYPAQFAAANGLSGPLEVYFRLVPLGARVDTTTTEGQRVVAGAQGTLAGWSYDAAYTHSFNTVDYAFTAGYVDAAGLRAAMATGLVNPFGDTGPEGLAILQSAQVSGSMRKATGTLDQVDFNLSRDLMMLPGGPLAVAVGAEGRHERLSDDPARPLATGSILGFPSEISAQSASRNAGAAYVEVNLPVAKGLELGASVRYDHYSDFGGTTNPKVAVRWQPAPSLLLRGAWGTGFRAPTLPDLFTPRFTRVVSGAGIYDPVRCPVTQSFDDCAGEYGWNQGGTTTLQPETSTQYTAGAIWEPVPGVSVGIEWWRLEKHNTIGNFIPAFIVENYGALGPTNVVRGPVDPAYPDLPGPIQSFNGWNENMIDLTTSGIDVALKAVTTSPALGRLQFSLDGTYIHSYVVGVSRIAPFDVAGTYGLAPVPRWRHYAQLNWQRGAWGATLAQTFQSSYTEALPSDATLTRTVGTYSVWDVQGVYTGFRNASIAVGVRNLLDADPPLTFQTRSWQVGYDPGYADPRGRVYYLRLTYAFK